jgi:hypothetical protein
LYGSCLGPNALTLKLHPPFTAQINLDVSKNEISGSMDVVGSLSGLDILFLSDNPFDPGDVPEAFTSLPLTELSIRNTNRVGALPEFPPSIQLLDLGSNQFNGTIPASYGKFSELEYLLINNNSGITGTLPASFKDIRTLKGGFFDGTGLKNNTLDILCAHKNFVQADKDEIIRADCFNCSCPEICVCCDERTDPGGCSQPPLNNIDASWGTFRRQEDTYRNVSAQFKHNRSTRVLSNRGGS